MKIRVKKLYPDAKLPTYSTPYAAGADLYAYTEKDVTIEPHTTVFVTTGLSVEIPDGYAGLVYARSGLASKNDLAPANKVGVIDSDYRGEIAVGLVNLSAEDYTVQAGDRIAQLMVVPVVRPVLVQAETAEVHILEDEPASRAYVSQMWAEVMEVYRRGEGKLKLSAGMERYLKEHQKLFMPEDTFAARILNFLDGYGGKMVCSLQIYYEGLGHPSYEEPKQYEIRDINSVMKNYAAGWKAFENPRHFPAPYHRQKGWERAAPDNGGQEKSGFQFLPEQEAVQLGLPEEWLQGEKA